jgi:signal recognition particle receptor subunit beta
VFDVGGQKSLRDHWNEYLSNCSGVVWVIDSADRRRIYETGVELGLVLRSDRLKGVPILVLANKQDLATALPPDEVLCVVTPDLARVGVGCNQGPQLADPGLLGNEERRNHRRDAVDADSGRLKTE